MCLTQEIFVRKLAIQQSSGNTLVILATYVVNMYQIVSLVLSKVSTVPNVRLDSIWYLLVEVKRMIEVNAWSAVHLIPTVVYVNIQIHLLSALSVRLNIHGKKIFLTLLLVRKIAVQMKCGEKNKMIARYVLLTLKGA